MATPARTLSKTRLNDYLTVSSSRYLQIRTERILAYTKFYQEQKNDVNSNLDSDVEQDTEKEVDYKTGEKENKNPIN